MMDVIGVQDDKGVIQLYLDKGRLGDDFDVSRQDGWFRGVRSGGLVVVEFKGWYVMGHAGKGRMSPRPQPDAPRCLVADLAFLCFFGMVVVM